MMNRALGAHAALNMAVLPRVDQVTDDVRDRINDLERMYNPEADNGNDHSDYDEADESNDRVAREHAALTATETLVDTGQPAGRAAHAGRCAD